MPFFIASVAIAVFFLSLTIHVTLRQVEKKTSRRRVTMLILYAAGCIAVSIPYVVYVLLYKFSSPDDPLFMTVLINIFSATVLFAVHLMTIESVEKALAFEIFVSIVFLVSSYFLLGMSIFTSGIFIIILCAAHFLGRISSKLIRV